MNRSRRKVLLRELFSYISRNFAVPLINKYMDGMEKKIISIESGAFKTIMNKLDRIDAYIRESAELSRKMNTTLERASEEVLKVKDLEILSLQEAAKLLKVSVRTMYRYKKKIPHIQFEGKACFLRSEILNCSNNISHKNSHAEYERLVTAGYKPDKRG